MNEPLPEGIRLSESWVLPASPSEVWLLVAQTDRLNEMMGNPPVRYEDMPQAEGGVTRTGRFSLMGLPLSWDEAPYEWIEGKQMSVRRTFYKGPISMFYLRVALEPCAAGTRLTSELVLTPRAPVLNPLVSFLGKGMHRSFDRVYRHYADYLKGEATEPFVLPAHTPSSLQQERCRSIAEKLQGLGFSKDLVERLVRYVLDAQDYELQKIRPYVIARVWQADRKDVLRLFLHATRAGLLELKWSLLCPGCRGSADDAESLGELSGNVHCSSCNINFEADFGQSVELSFRPNRVIRTVEPQEFCIGGPYRTAHVVMQALLEAKTPLDVALDLSPGTYRLRSPQVANHLTLSVEEAGLEPEAIPLIRIAPEGFGPASLELAATTARLRLEASHACQVTLERTAWADDVVTGAYVSTLHEFRTLFSHEVLAADLELGITRIAIMFTDLKSSTAMYEQLGDATAFRLVQTHFRILEEAIASNNGAIVKTVGDAVMASFYDAADCVRAAFEIQTSIQRHNEQNPDQPASIIVKLGAHIGPCIAVTLNERLDYFGTTVNVAARVQNEATGGDVVLSEAMLEDPGVQQLLADLPISETSVNEAFLKGLANTFELTRLVPDVRGLAEGRLRQHTGRLT